MWDIRMHPTKGLTFKQIAKELLEEFPTLKIKIVQNNKTIIDGNDMEVC